MRVYQEERESRRDASPDDIERYRFIKEQHERMEEERRKHALKVYSFFQCFKTMCGIRIRLFLGPPGSGLHLSEVPFSDKSDERTEIMLAK